MGNILYEFIFSNGIQFLRSYHNSLVKINIKMGNFFFRAHNNQPNQNQQQNVQNFQLNDHILGYKLIKMENRKQMHIYVKLESSVSKTEIENILNNPKLMELFENQTWCINYDNTQTNYQHLLPIVDQCTGVKTLKIIASKRQTFKSDILKPKFIELTKLTLSDCQLESVQFLTGMYMPNLKELFLNYNVITRVKPLRKLMGRIQVLNLRYNPITNLRDDQIHMINFAQDAQALNFQEGAKQNYGDDISWYFKMPFKILTRVEILGRNRMNIPIKLAKKLKGMYKGTSQTFCWIKVDYY